MTDDLIRYDVLAQEALRGVLRKVMVEVAQTGLPGDHHFFITFDTNYPGVRISSRLAAQHPDEMTVVMQHQFWDLNVTDTTFEIGLSFNGIPERLLVPFMAITAFVDPHVNFGLKFEAEAAEGGAADTAGEQPESDADGESSADETVPAPDEAPVANNVANDVAKDSATEAGAEVVSLDSFRKKNG